MGNTEKPNKKPHSITLDERKILRLTGIEDVLSFDENGMLLATADGTLTVDGSEIHIVTLSVETGEILVQGRFCGLYYVDHVPKQGGFFSRKG